MESQRTAFGTVLFGGFQKEAVYKYIEQLMLDHETTCKRYELQMNDLNRELARMNAKIEELSERCEALQAEKADLVLEKDALKDEIEALKRVEE